jgi:hypothetical protein
MAAAELDLGRTDRAARYVVPVERGDYGLELACHPVVSFYAGRVYELLAMAAPKYREAVEESLAEKFSSAVASKDESQWASPNSRSWLIFLAKRAYSQAARSDWSLNHAMPIMPETATAEPSFVPTVGELLECLGSTDFAAQSRRKLRAIKLYQSEPELFHDRHWMKRGQFIA